MPAPTHQPRPLTNTPFGRKLGYYLLGLAIGLMMVGMIVSARQQFLGQPPQQAGTPPAPSAPPAPPATR